MESPVTALTKAEIEQQLRRLDAEPHGRVTVDYERRTLRRALVTIQGLLARNAALDRLRFRWAAEVHAGSHHGNGSPGCPRAAHHHHDQVCVLNQRHLDELSAALATSATEEGKP